NSLIKHVQKLFAMEDVELEVRPAALTATAQRAIKRRTGARGLRSIVEQSLLDTMYDLPSLKNVEPATLDENAITGDGSTLLIYEEQTEDAASEPSRKLKGAA